MAASSHTSLHTGTGPDRAYLQLSGVSKRYPGNRQPALDNVSLTLDRGTVMALLGESGSGKTTLLRLLAGFDQPDGGSIDLAGKLVADARTAIPPEERSVGVVFQETALLPHLTIRQNVSFGLRKMPERSRRERAEATLRLMGIAEYRHRYPHEVSGGQAQRAAIGRALAPRPALLLLDEPFHNLDPVLKWHLFQELGDVLRDTRTTAVFVTHDRDEAFTVADTMAVLHRGRIEQVGNSERLYTAPANAFVAQYLGAVNLLPVERTGDAWSCVLGRIGAATPFRLNGGVAVSVRPGQLRVAPADDDGLRRADGLNGAHGSAGAHEESYGTNRTHPPADAGRRPDGDNGGIPHGLRGVVQAQRFMGEFRELRVRVTEMPTVRELTVHVPAFHRYRIGQQVTVTLARQG